MTIKATAITACKECGSTDLWCAMAFSKAGSELATLNACFLWAVTIAPKHWH
jgi:hypothetical protein